MRLLHYLEIRNFKHFGDRQRIRVKEVERRRWVRNGRH